MTTKETQQGRAAGSQTVTCSKVRVKKENDGDSTGEHLHCFKVKFSKKDVTKTTFDCDQPRTVLEVLKSSIKYQELMFTDENIVIQLGKGDKALAVATHFPCSCIREGEILILSLKKEKVEQAQQYKTVHSRDEYSVFYIDTAGGLNTKTKKLFINNAVKQFKYLCVYGEKGMTVEEALKRDGRFIDDLRNFTLIDNKHPSNSTEFTRKVDNLDGKEFKICLPRNTSSKTSMQETPGASDISQQRRERDTAVLEVLQQRETSVRAAVANKDKHVNTEEIYRKLREQYPGLKELMESRFPDDSYQKALDLRREDFGKIQRLFNQVHRVRELIKLGESVCKVVVGDVHQGTGFVLFDNFILTNAHLLKGCVEGEKLKEGIDVYVLFNYEDPEPHTKYYYFPIEGILVNYSEGELDYAILEINSEKYSQATQTTQIEVPPGLLQIFGPLPQNGEACIVGHPAGGLKQMDPTCIIEKEKREQAVHDHLQPYKDNIFIVYSITHLIKKQGIEDMMIGGYKADNVATYNTFMYHGSSGSPVFDAHGRVFGLHSAGFVYGYW
ncbi:serine protease FAM111A-like [Anarhichas minor]|uniref:serine protease FAM111A-like n=1 Tax=Anarhichas minor TaxID=65739 RepID=UPI003F73B0F9